MKWVMKTFLPVLILCLFVVGQVRAKTLGTVGRVYAIAEPDALVEIEERARDVDWTSILNKEKPEDFRPTTLVRLPRVRHERSFLVDMTYTLDFDVPDGRGGLLYPKGFRFNPLDYVPFNQTLVVVDGDDPIQRAWLQASPLVNEANTVILLSQGAFSQISTSLGRAVFYADRRIIERFNLRAVPSVITRRDRLMEVKEIEIPTSDSADR